MCHPTDSIAHTTAFVTPVVEHWLEREIGRKEGRKKGRKEVLSFNDAQDTFLYTVMWCPTC